MTRMLGSDAILRSLEARGRRRGVRHPGRRDPADLRRDRARDDGAARARPPRAGRRPHGRGLRARVRQGRRRDRDVRPGRDEPRHADRRRVDGLDAARLHHRPGALEPDRHRRVPGDRRDRHHDADRQALVARAGRARAAGGDEGRVPRRAHRPARARCSSTSRRTCRRPSSTSRTPTTSTCPGWKPPTKVHERQVREAAKAIAEARAADRLRGRRRAQRRRLRRAARARRGGAASRGRDADGQGLPARLAPAQLRRARACTARSTRTGR